MKRDVLEYARLPDVGVGQLSPQDRLICAIAWMADNAEYGIKDAAKKLIDEIRQQNFQPTPAQTDNRRRCRTCREPLDLDHNCAIHGYQGEVDTPPPLSEARLPLQEVTDNGPAPLTFARLHAVSFTRALRWHPNGLEEWNIAEWTNAMAGEAGEACNASKKLRRIECRMQQADGDSVAPKTLEEAKRKVGKEVGDTVIYADLVARQAGMTLEECVILAFNQISEREGFPERL